MRNFYLELIFIIEIDYRTLNNSVWLHLDLCCQSRLLPLSASLGDVTLCISILCVCVCTSVLAH